MDCGLEFTGSGKIDPVFIKSEFRRTYIAAGVC
jgi:hypothetical protein